MPIDIAGQRFGRLTAIAIQPERIRGKTAWSVRCDCGTSLVVLTERLRSGNTRSCGCFAREAASLRISERNSRHGLSYTPTWRIWSGMLQRCSNVKLYPNYAGRGISVCERWKSFENFLADMGERPSGMTIERRDTNGNYEPGNCHWATTTEQNRNKRDTLRLSFGGRTMCTAEWAREIGVLPGTLWKRIANGWSVQEALTTPINPNLRRLAALKGKAR